MIRFHTLTLRNFLSYGNNITTIVLDNTGTTLIVGQDLDNTSNGQGANGTGKSSILNGLCYGIYDRPVSSISKDNLVNNINKSNMEVTVEFTAENKKKYLIKRVRKAKSGAAGNTVYLFEDDKDITLDSSANTNALIESIVGIPYELFVRIVVFSASNTPFLDLPLKSANGANQTDIIEELFGLTMLSAKANALKDIIKETEGKSNIQRTRVSLLEQEHARHQQQIEHAKEQVVNWQLKTQKQVADLTDKLKRVESVDIEKEQQAHKKHAEVTTKLQQIRREYTQVASQIKTITTHLTSKNDELTHLNDDTCPYCKQQYKDAQSKIKDTTTSLETLKKEKIIFEKEGDDLKVAIDELNTEIHQLNSQITVSDIGAVIEIKNQVENIKAKIVDLNTTENPLLNSLEFLENAKLEQIDYTEINKLERELDHLKFLHKILTKKDSFVRKALLNKNIPFLNTKLQQYLEILGLPHRVVFTHEMTAEISQFGQSLDFGNLSAGQRARVNLALSFSFRDVLQTLHAPINVCILDEVLDVGLDSIGVQAAARLLKRKSRDENLGMFIISHRDEVNGIFDKTLTVQISQGFSYIKDSEVHDK